MQFLILTQQPDGGYITHITTSHHYDRLKIGSSVLKHGRQTDGRADFVNVGTELWECGGGREVELWECGGGREVECERVCLGFLMPARPVWMMN